jgi:YVTN family beta-propeller protein
LPELHGGTVTFLFTDIEGSTRLLKQLGGSYGEVLADHQRILRAAFAAHGGQEVDSQGDSFFIAFRTAKDAVAAAVDAQRDLEAQTWPEGARVKVRMGLHTGEPKVGGERYVGIGVHRAARIGAAGHGGQVLLSSTTKELAEEDLPPGVSIRDLGERRLKDLDQRQRLYQLVIEGLPTEFKPLRTLDVELKRKRRRLYAGSALIGAAAAAVAIPIFALGQGSSGGSGVKVVPNSVAVIDPQTNTVTDDLGVGARPGEIVSGSGAVWVANLADDTVSRIDPETRRVVRAIPINVEPTGLAAGAGAIWFASAGQNSYLNGFGYTTIRLGRIDPSFDTRAGTIELKNKAQWGAVGPVAAGRSSVWVTGGAGVIRVDPATGRETLTATGTGRGYGIALNGVTLGGGATWVSDEAGNRVVRIDPTGVLTATIPVGNAPSALAVGEGAVWVTDTGDDQVKRIDPSTNAVTTTIKVSRSPTGIAVGAGAVWVANSGDGTVSKIDPRTNTVARTFKVGGSPTGILVANGLVWITVQEGESGAGGALAGGRQGGTARVDVSGGGPGRGVNHTDPALAFLGAAEPQVQNATCAQLVGYPDRPGPAGSQLAPDVARSLPTLSADRRTYTFKIRPGFRFSPPSTAVVTAATFKYSIERSLNPRMNGQAPFFLSDIVGVKAFEAGKASHVAGISASGDKLSIRLTGVSGSFLSRLAMNFSCAVPSNTPVDPKGLPAIPSAGPYYVASFRPNRRLVLKRNPNYRGPRPHRLDEIDFALNVGEAQAVKEVEAGRADYAAWQEIPRSESTRLAAYYGPASPPGRAGRQQYFVSPQIGVLYYALNAARPLFASASMRRAVNFAVDRAALVAATQCCEFLATDQYVPPGITGFRDAHIYPLERPNLARARRLAGSRSRSAVLYTCDNPDCVKRAQVLVRNLAAIGIDLEVDTFSRDVLGNKIATKGEPWDIADAGWITDGYFDPFDFLNVLFDSNLLLNGKLATTLGYDISRFDDSAYNRRLEEAAKLTGAARYRTYARLEADLTRNAAPLLAYGNITSQDFFSARMGCQVYGPYGVNVAALCIRGHARP